MKTKILILFFALLPTISLVAQVGVGTTDPNSTLDVRSSNQVAPTNEDGLLIPKIDEFPVTNPTVAQDGMLVYATGLGTLVKGFYYWDQTITDWVIITGSLGWLETGNAGTNPSTNFIGTTDAQDLSFRTNNLEKIRLTQQGQLEFLNTGNSVFIGEGAGENDNLTFKRNTFVGHLSGNSNISGSSNSFFGGNSGNSNTTGNSNSFFGGSSGFNNTIGIRNTFVGSSSGLLNISGNNNSFFGDNSGNSNTTGNDNSFFGRFSGAGNTVGIDNVALGSRALQTNTIGSDNVAIGFQALSLTNEGNRNVAIGTLAGSGSGNNSKNNGVFIGFRAGISENNDNRLYIESSSSTTPLIYGEFDNDILRVNGTLEVNNPTATGYSFPITDGTVNQVLQTDGTGNVTFVDTNTLDTNDWKKTGNAGTDASLDFIGTTDAQDLSFRTNNIEKIKLTQQGQLEFLNTGNSIFIGEGAGENDDLTDNNNSFVGHGSGRDNTSGNFNSFFGLQSGFRNTTGSSNSFFGMNSGLNNSTGSSNAAFGFGSLSSNLTGGGNTAVGVSSLTSNISGLRNVAIGNSAAFRTIGSSNTVIGTNALLENSTGNFNVAIGDSAGLGASGNSKSNGIFIGYQAGMNEDNSNRLYIESSSSLTPLIYGEFDNDILRVNGTLEVNNPTATGYSFPITDGTANQVLQTDGTGNVTFVDTNTLDTNDWKKTGNAGTDASLDFIGTTDAQDLSFRIQNQERMRLTQDGRIQLTNLEHSVYIGEDAGANENQIAGNNSYIGFMAGALSSGQENNSFFGAEAGALSSASRSTFFGARSGYNTGGSDNTFLGYRAGHMTTVGLANIYIGSRAGENVSGENNYNIFIGMQSAENFTGGSANVSMGFQTLANAEGENNVAIGDRSGNIVDGDNNSFLGSLAGNLVGGDNNTFLGHRAGFDVPGSLNTFIGSQAGETIDGESNLNVFIGSNAADNFTQGDFNVAMGSNAMRFGEGDENVIIGSGALANANQNFNTVILGSRASENSNGVANSVIIGELAAGNADFTTDSVIIGHQAGQSLTDISQKLIIHNQDSSFPLIYGEFDDSLLGIHGDVAINHQDPQAALHVQSFENVNTQSAVAILESDTSNRPVLLFAKENPTSINDFNAGMSLEYDGRGANNTNKMVFNGIGGNSLFEFQNGGDLKILDGDLVIEGTAGDRHLRMDDAAGNNDRVLLRQAGTNHIFAGDIDNNGGNFTIRTGGANAMTILSGSRNVGIGTTNPTFRLQVSTNSAAKPTSQLWTVVSDRRLKKDVSSFTDGIETLKQINPVWFTYNGIAEMPNETGVGTIAQELAKVAPYLVKDWEYKSEDGSTENYKAVDYGPLTFIMVNAIKEQASEIANLKILLERQHLAHEQELKEIKNRLSNLEN